ncbi:ROK family protein [Herbiconiux sp. A18JL235]|uniref:ROK family protein n=1 Tax=Herbiconiux sp. A18JL235 TaxID=3152363 RepID=A0AB39BG72_9MICO
MTELCIDFGGSAIKLGVCDDGRILAHAELPVRGTPDDLTQAAGELRRLAHTQVGSGTPSWGGASVVSIAVPGVVDRRRCALIAAHDKYGYLAGRDLDAWSRETFGLPAVVENDARAALLGEARYGVAVGAQNAVIALFGTGIGTAALLDGRLLHGGHDHAGILGGHVTVDLDGPVCSCGNVGCAEALASTWALERSLAAVELHGFATNGGPSADSERRAGPSAPAPAEGGDRRTPGDLSSLRERIDAGAAIGIADVVETLDHSDSRTLLDRYLRVWSAAIVTLCHAYDPDVVIVSGGVMRSAPLIVPALTEQVHAHLWSSSFRPPLVVPDRPDVSVVLGLSALAQSDGRAPSATERPRT